MNYHEALRANIGAELGRRDISQAQAAAQLGLAQSSFSSRLQGRTEFKLSELVALSSFLGVPLAGLVGDIDTKPAAFVGEEGAR